MFGIESPGIYLAYVGSILSALLCIIYGFINWNKGSIDNSDIKNDEKEKDN